MSVYVSVFLCYIVSSSSLIVTGIKVSVRGDTTINLLSPKRGYAQAGTCIVPLKSCRVHSIVRFQSFDPLDRRSENESTGNNHFEITKEITTELKNDCACH